MSKITTILIQFKEYQLKKYKNNPIILFYKNIKIFVYTIDIYKKNKNTISLNS
jgi:hypothetical protein